MNEKPNPHSMNRPFLAAALVLATLTCGRAQPTTSYTDRAAVDGFGLIALPAGEWSLEFRRITPNEARNRPSYIVFKRRDRLERLTLLRYAPVTPTATKPRNLTTFLDTIVEDLGDGIPFQEKERTDQGGTIHPMRSEPPTPNANDRYISLSFIHIHPSPKPSWLSHVVLFSREGFVFIIAHASMSVTNPETVEDVQSGSTFTLNTASTQTPK